MFLISKYEENILYFYYEGRTKHGIYLTKIISGKCKLVFCIFLVFHAFIISLYDSLDKKYLFGQLSTIKFWECQLWLFNENYKMNSVFVFVFFT